MPQKNDFSDNITLLRKYRNGDRIALETLVKNNTSLVRRIALRFTGRGQELEDLTEVGIIGLLKAIDGFDESLGYSFPTYAFPLITGEIKRFLRDDGPIKVSRSIKTNAITVTRARETFTSKYKREPRLSELSQETGLSAEEITEAFEISIPPMSLEDKVGNSENSATVGETVRGDDTIELLTDKLALRQAIGTLSQKEQCIVDLRFYRNLTQTKVSELLGISQVTVSRTEKKIIDKLRQEIL
ncbi:MAG: sigma-70 family RNA polymerase sigma factor [Clostridia bacterium]|nr:sigma-70 family RNA polymerase sigma factor [Clostridia bacterium]